LAKNNIKIYNLDRFFVNNAKCYFNTAFFYRNKQNQEEDVEYMDKITNPTHTNKDNFRNKYGPDKKCINAADTVILVFLLIYLILLAHIFKRI